MKTISILCVWVLLSVFSSCDPTIMDEPRVEGTGYREIDYKAQRLKFYVVDGRGKISYRGWYIKGFFEEAYLKRDTLPDGKINRTYVHGRDVTPKVIDTLSNGDFRIPCTWATATIQKHMSEIIIDVAQNDTGKERVISFQGRGNKVYGPHITIKQKPKE